MVLRATYAPELRSGMTRAEVAARLPAILRRINPAGEGVAYRALPQHPAPGSRKFKPHWAQEHPQGTAWAQPRVP